MYENPHSAGYEVMSKSRGYSLGSAGDISSSATYLVTNDFPEYAGMFYSPTEHETISSIRYSKMELGYDSESRQIHESLQGTPLEFYIPHSAPMPESAPPQIKPLMNIKRKTEKKIVDEIEEAQKKIMGKEIVMREVEEVVLLRKTKRREIILRDRSVR